MIQPFLKNRGIRSDETHKIDLRVKSGDTDHIDVGLYQTGDYLSEIDLGTPASMRNAWGQFGGHRKLGLSVLASAVLYATLVACDPLTVMEESDPSKLTVMYSGCHTVQEGLFASYPSSARNRQLVRSLSH